MKIKQPQLLPMEAFVRQSMTLLEAYAYLLQTEVVAVRKEHADLAQAYQDLKFKTKDHYTDPTIYFVARLFISLVSDFEIFLQDTATAVVLKNPKKVGSITFSLSDILDSPTPEALVRRAIDEWLNKLMYKRPAEYLKELSATLSIDEAPLQEKWKLFVEAKARRDVGVHNDWKCNVVYLRKVAEAGIQSTSAVGDSMIPTAEYFKASNDTLAELAISISSAVIAKHWPETDFKELNFKF